MRTEVEQDISRFGVGSPRADGGLRKGTCPLGGLPRGLVLVELLQAQDLCICGERVIGKMCGVPEVGKDASAVAEEGLCEDGFE
ncbi:MAG: hypothetical protein RL215_3337 [Planctomycetota bacterium]